MDPINNFRISPSKFSSGAAVNLKIDMNTAGSVTFTLPSGLTFSNGSNVLVRTVSSGVNSIGENITGPQGRFIVEAEMDDDEEVTRIRIN